jgi:hypothetical protein
MISKKLAGRTFLIKASPLPNRVQDSYSHRRGKNFVMTEEDDPSYKYDTFFEYEDDLANLKASGEQYADMVSDDPYVILEDKDAPMDEAVENHNPYGNIIMEEAEKVIESEEKDTDYKDVVGFTFIQCSFMKTDGDRCKRQAPKGHEICSVHKKYIKKHNH